MKKIYLLFFIASLLLISCNKNKKELKIPTEVGFKMDINRNKSPQGFLKFNGGNIFIQSMSVDGDREEGESISFTKEFPNGLNITFSPSGIISELDFDIPQGNYYELIISFSTKYNNGNNTLKVTGEYTDSTNTIYPVIFEFKGEEYFSIVGESVDGSPSIVLDKNVNTTTLIKFDPVYWFGLVSRNSLNNANKTIINGDSTILINQDINSDIYDVIVDRIDEANLALWD